MELRSDPGRDKILTFVGFTSAIAWKGSVKDSVVITETIVSNVDIALLLL